MKFLFLLGSGSVEILLIRHGETDWNLQGKVQGFSDIELNIKGIKQAQALADYLKNQKIDRVYSSPLKRALITAKNIADKHNIQVEIKNELMELNQGDLEGISLLKLQDKYSELLKQWYLDASLVTMPNGEGLKDLQNRVWRVIEEISKLNLDNRIVVVSHNFTIMSIICRVLELDLKNFKRLRHDVAAISKIEFDGKGYRLTGLNDRHNLDNIITE